MAKRKEWFDPALDRVLQEVVEKGTKEVIFESSAIAMRERLRFYRFLAQVREDSAHALRVEASRVTIEALKLYGEAKPRMLRLSCGNPGSVWGVADVSEEEKKRAEIEEVMKKERAEIERMYGKK